MTPYERALQKLYRAPLNEFLAERNRLAGEVRAAGDKTGGAKIAIRRRPTISVWHAREAFEVMLAAAARLRKGDVDVTAEYRGRVANLRDRAATILKNGGHAASDATLRRVATTLAAIAAGGFDPDPPGALAADRDPPGFEVVGIPAKPIRQKPAERETPEGRAKTERPHERSDKHNRGRDEPARASPCLGCRGRSSLYWGCRSAQRMKNLRLKSSSGETRATRVTGKGEYGTRGSRT